MLVVDEAQKVTGWSEGVKLFLTRVDKPAFLRRLFQLACDYSRQIVPYQKLVGQSQDAGSIATITHYLELLSGGGLVTGLQKSSGAKVGRRGSSPKLVVMNTALMSALTAAGPAEARRRRDLWGRLVESAGRT